MVLLAPTTQSKVATEAGAEVETEGGRAVGSGGSDEVLALLRGDPGERPRFDPGLAGGLRAWLEDAASALVLARGENAPPLYLGPRRLFGASLDTAVSAHLSMECITSCLVRVLFRQLVTAGTVGDPLTDALAALRVDPWRQEVVTHISGCSSPARAALAESLANHVEHLRGLTPEFAPGWLPRTNDRVAIPLAGGRVVLHGVFDLLVGVPVTGVASLCAIGLTTGGSWDAARRALDYVVLLELLRSGTPPFRVALLHSGLGRVVVDDVVEAEVGAMVSQVAGRLYAMAASGE